MSLWIPIVVGAAFLQNLRSLLQKRLTGALSVGGATFARFVFAFPLALVYALAVSGLSGWWPEAPEPVFWAWLVTGATGQLVATYLLVASFTHGPFAIGTAYSKTEALQAAIVAFVLLGEALSAAAVGAILLGLAGVALMAFRRRSDGLAALDITNRAVLFGLGAGLAFAFSSVGYRGASLALGEGSVFARAGWTLAATTLLQTVAFGAFLAWREPGQVTRVLALWRQAGLVALVGVAGSIGWFTALTLQTAALVKAVAQVELVFSTLTGWLHFREPVTLREVAGIALVGLSVVLIVLMA